MGSFKNQVGLSASTGGATVDIKKDAVCFGGEVIGREEDHRAAKGRFGPGATEE